MCTVSWLRDPDGYFLYFNRDERVTRKPARPPVVVELGGVRCVAPADGDFGGTWIAANERGLTLGLLNRYAGAVVDPTRRYTSRGHLLLGLADAATLGGVRDRLARTDVTNFQPFTLVAVAPGEPALVVEWTGASRSFQYDAERLMPLVSSGVDQEGVAALRRRQLRDLGTLTPEALEAFHRSHLPERGASSTCMHRDDASTVSFTRVHVSGDAVSLDYTPSSPCAAAPPVSLSIARRLTRARSLAR